MFSRYIAILDFFVVAHRKEEEIDEGRDGLDEVENELPPENEGKLAQSQRAPSEILKAGETEHEVPPPGKRRDKFSERDEPKVSIAYEPDQQTTSTDLLKGGGEEQACQPHPPLPRCSEWIEIASLEHHLRCHTNQAVSEVQLCPAKDDEQFWQYYDGNPSTANERPCPSISHYALQAMMNNTPLRSFKDPPKPISLASVTGKNKSRNQDVDILAVIESIDASTTKPARLSLKRDIRIVDPSVDEPVTVSVFMDPVNFRSTVGTVALFRHVTTHDWRRGNLNAYPARVKGREWFIPMPSCLGFDEDIRRLQRWWGDHCGLRRR